MIEIFKLRQTQRYPDLDAGFVLNGPVLVSAVPWRFRLFPSSCRGLCVVPLKQVDDSRRQELLIEA